MRLTQFLTLAVAMSRNQAKYSIRKGRTCVDGKVIIDPNFEVFDHNNVTFDSNPISIVKYQYFILNKPVSFTCTTVESEEKSVLNLIKKRSRAKDYYLANVLSDDVTGLVLISDNARWVNRTKLKTLEKISVYQLKTKEIVTDDQVLKMKKAFLISGKRQMGSEIDIQKKDEKTLMLSIKHFSLTDLINICNSKNIHIVNKHLQQVGALELGDLKAGDYLELTEKDIRL